MKRIIGIGLIALLAFTAVGLARPDEASAHNAEFYDAIRRFFDGEISRAQLEAELNA